MPNAAETDLLGTVSFLREKLQELEQELLARLRNIEKGGLVKSIEEREIPKLFIPLSEEIQSGIGSDLTLATPPIVVVMKPFSKIVPRTAPNSVDGSGEFFDAGEVFDGWIVLPSVDTLISFTGPPEPGAPAIPAGISMNFPLAAQKIYYRAQNATQTGTLSLWLGKY